MLYRFINSNNESVNKRFKRRSKMLYRPYQRITFNNKKYMNTYGYLGCFNCAFENDEESCIKVNKENKCGQKDNKRKDKVEFIFKEIFEEEE